MRVAAAFALALALPAIAAGQVRPSPLIAPVVFHWDQTQNPFPTLEGASVDDGSVAFWRRQIKVIERAGFTAQLFQVVDRGKPSERNHLRAMRERRAEGGPLPPLLAPFFAAESFPDYDAPKEILSPAGFEAFYQMIRGFFLMYAESFPARPGQPGVLDPELLATVDGRVYIVMWFVPLTSVVPPAGFFDRLSDRLQQDFGFRAYWSAHVNFANGGPDDLNFLFNGSAPIQFGRNTRFPAVDLLVAFWPPNLQQYRADLFAPRNGGQTYTAAWNGVIAANPRPVIVLVESYNEITEGSHLMPSFPLDHRPGDGHWTGPPDDPRCVPQACHPVEFTDTWGSDNPWHYLDLTRTKIREWLEGASVSAADRDPPHVFIVTPKTDDGGTGLIPVQILARDERALREVRVYIDGRLAIVERGPVNALMKSHLMSRGRHRLLVEAVDQAGNVDTDVSDFVVIGPPQPDFPPVEQFAARTAADAVITLAAHAFEADGVFHPAHAPRRLVDHAFQTAANAVRAASEGLELDGKLEAAVLPPRVQRVPNLGKRPDLNDVTRPKTE